MKTKKTSTLSDKIADSFRTDIIYGKLKPGLKIVEQEIAEKYETSHIPVREALRIFEGEGLLVYRKFAGYTIREVNPEEMIELYNIMRFLTDQSFWIVIRVRNFRITLPVTSRVSETPIPKAPMTNFFLIQTLRGT